MYEVVRMEQEKKEKQIPEITRETQIEMMKFFLKTSIPRILKKREQEEKDRDL